MRANNNGWPMFNGRFVNYPQFKKEWQAYRQAYHALVSNDLAAKTLREKCVSGEAVNMIGHLEDLDEIWETLDTCYERLEKYMVEALKPILEFRKDGVYDNCAVRKFTHCLEPPIGGQGQWGISASPE
jgi:hypothetical protein